MLYRKSLFLLISGVCLSALTTSAFLGRSLGPEARALGAIAPPREAGERSSRAGQERLVATPERISRGSYLANSVTGCIGCHSPLVGSDPDPKRLGAGDILSVKTGLVAPNITPDPKTGIGTWSDRSIVRAIREGVRHDGRRISAKMPWYLYSVLTDEDVASIVCYLRSLPPVQRELPPSHAPVKEPALAPVRPAAQSSLANPVKRGEYMARLSLCVECHTPLNRVGKLDTRLLFGGGRRFELRGSDYAVKENDPWLASDQEPDTIDPKSLVASSNLTAHPSGISYYTEDIFLRTLRTGRVNGVRELSPAMPVSLYQTMTDADLKAIYAYLRSLPPVAHRVGNQDPPTHCPVCGRRHGLGSSNGRGAH